MIAQSRTIHVAHVVSSLGVGGIERWLVELVRQAASFAPHVCFTIIVLGPPGQRLESDLLAAGARVVTQPRETGLVRQVIFLNRTLRRTTGIDIIHSHPFAFSGIVLGLAWRRHIPVRIAHAHNTASVVRNRFPWGWDLAASLLRRLIRRFATHRIMVSRKAGEALFRDDRAKADYIPCGAVPPPPGAARSGRQDRVVAAIGRLTQIKNIPFFVEVVAELSRRDPRVVGLVVGDGPERLAVEQAIHALKMDDRIQMLGMRDDVPTLLTSRIDLLVMPSLNEGLPVAALEAQAAGLPVLLSDRVTDEIVVLPGLVERLPLEAPAGRWAAAALELIERAEASDRRELMRRFAESRFTSSHSVREVLQLYHRAIHE